MQSLTKPDTIERIVTWSTTGVRMTGKTISDLLYLEKAGSVNRAETRAVVA